MKRRLAWLRALQERFASASIEDNLKLLGFGGLALFVTLVASLFYVQTSLVSSQRALTRTTLPMGLALGRLDAALGDAFRREAQLSSTRNPEQLAPLRDRAAIETELRAAQAELLRSGTRVLGSGSRQKLGEDLEAFLAADAELLASIERRHELQGRFTAQLAHIDDDLRTLVQSAQSISGILRLQFVVTLREIHQHLRRGAAAPPDLVRQITVGVTRGALDNIAELVDATLALGVLVGKTGLAKNQDVLNAVLANELAQNRLEISRVFDALQVQLKGGPLFDRVTELRARFEELSPRILDEKRDDSLAHLRRTVLEEIDRAQALRARSIAIARAVSTVVQQTHVAVTGLATEAVAATARATQRSRVFSGAISIIGLIVCCFAALRIRGSVAALRAYNRELSELKTSLEHMNQNLEGLVERRTAALQLVLDSMSDGMISVAAGGTLRAERSKTVVAWFGEPPPQISVWDYLYGADREQAEAFRVGFEQLVADELPFELCADQMPQHIERDQRSYDMSFQPAAAGDARVGVVIAIRDVTLQLEAERAEQLARSEQRTIAHLLRDKAGFSRMVRECENLIAQVIGAEDLVLRRRTLHTLKGNCAIFGLVVVAELAHELESTLDAEQTLSDADLERLRQCWHDSMVRIEEFVTHARGTYEVAEAELQMVLAALQRRDDYAEIVRMVEAFRLEPAAAPLKRLGAQARRLAGELGKNLDVRVVDNGVRLPPEQFQSLFSALVHAIRNAVDHGLETPAERTAAGKSEVGTLGLRAARTDDGKIIIELADDGRGVDYDAVRAKALAHGLPANTTEDLHAALFMDGFSSRDQASALSGRGVGLSALRAECLAMSGTAELHSTKGHGTTLRCVVPMPRPSLSAGTQRSQPPLRRSVRPSLRAK